jgi:adenylate kinase
VRIVLVGPPGAGKGTQAQFIASHLAIPKISTGDIFRHNVSRGTTLGRKAKDYMGRGDLVPDEITVAMVRDRLSEDDAQEGFLLDGFPRNVAQAEELETILVALGTKLDVVVELVVDTEEVVKRIAGRRLCRNNDTHIFHVEFNPPAVEGVCDICGGELYQRDDDEEETVRGRLAVYARETAPIVGYYNEHSLLRSVDAQGPMDEVTRRVLAAIADR